jgi:superfamily I DNA/RNA helicase
LVGKPETGSDIVTMTMNRYKGLEAPVVILCELDDSVYRRDRLSFDLKDLLYVGMTRPTGKLIVLATGEVFEFLKRGGFRVIEES